MKSKLILTVAGLIILAGLVIAVVILIPKIHFAKKTIEPVQKSLVAKPGYYKVAYVTDGDTFAVNMDGRTEKVRLIGVDTPETVKPNSPQECYGKIASDFTKHTLTDQTVRLEADPINQNRDRYNRLLRYAYLENGSLFNAKLISEGYAFAYLSFPFTKSEEFRQLQAKAREDGVGLWAGECKIQDQNGRYKTNVL